MPCEADMRQSPYRLKRLLVLLINIPLLAHDLYLMPERFVVHSGAKIRVAFHNGDGFPESQVAPRVERMIEPRILSASGPTAMKNLHPDGKVLLGEVTIPDSGNVIYCCEFQAEWNRARADGV